MENDLIKRSIPQFFIPQHSVRNLFWFCRNRYQVSNYLVSINLFLPLSIAGFALLIIGLFRKQTVNVKAFGVATLGFFYISLSWGFMLSLWQQGIQLCNISNNVITGVPYILIASIWINDTMAYIVGSLIGKTPLSKISPRKTWEGTIGGILLSTIIVAILAPQILVGQFYKPLAIFSGLIALIASVAGTFGDILESKLKRMAGVKDSGAIMPGHGGFLDRFDSLLLATPFAWLFVQLFMR